MRSDTLTRTGHDILPRAMHCQNNLAAFGSVCRDRLCSQLWYVPPMQRTTPPVGAVEGSAGAEPHPRRALGCRSSVVHAKALYRPVPPFDTKTNL